MDNLSKGAVIVSPEGHLFSVLSTHDAYQHPKYKRGKSVTIHNLETGTAHLIELRQLKGWTLSFDEIPVNLTSPVVHVAEKVAQPHVKGGVS